MPWQPAQLDAKIAAPSALAPSAAGAPVSVGRRRGRRGGSRRLGAAAGRPAGGDDQHQQSCEDEGREDPSHTRSFRDCRRASSRSSSVANPRSPSSRRHGRCGGIARGAAAWSSGAGWASAGERLGVQLVGEGDVHAGALVGAQRLRLAFGVDAELHAQLPAGGQRGEGRASAGRRRGRGGATDGARRGPGPSRDRRGRRRSARRPPRRRPRRGTTGRGRSLAWPSSRAFQASNGSSLWRKWSVEGLVHGVVHDALVDAGAERAGSRCPPGPATATTSPPRSAPMR